ncbi:hypothetical protein [Nonomuraea candida]|uniref:hypothetical protein n=1 Tax=Nonomuraea candida TaxID=359159 RepID=UPI0005BDE255|nr:hypothetical protein [Nonomuraea candida]
MTEPPEIFQRDVLRRHALPDQCAEQGPRPGDPTPAMERAWLARIVAAQKAAQVAPEDENLLRRRKIGRFAAGDFVGFFALTTGTPSRGRLLAIHRQTEPLC